MWYIVHGLVIGSGIGAAVLLLSAAGFALRRRWRLGGFLGSGALMRRAGIFTIVTGGLGAGLHFATLKSTGFVNGLPSALLAWDVRHERYAEPALARLSARSVEQTLGPDSALGITDALLGCDWWREAAGAIPFPATDPVQNWFSIQLEKGRIADGQLARWLHLVPPPNVFRIESTSESWDVVGEYGRQWQRSMNTPYRIDKINIDRITVNGHAVSFEAIEGGESESHYGWKAPVVRFHYVLPMDVRHNGESNVVEVEYHLDMEPGAYRGVGPMVWRGMIVPN